VAQREPIPINLIGNRSNIKTLEIEEADAHMLAMAMSIAICTAMTCGGREGIGRMRYYKEQLAKLAPPGAKLFSKDTDISEIAYLSLSTPNWSVYKIKESIWSKRFRVVFILDNRKFTSSGLLESTEEFDLMVAAVNQLVDIRCTQVEMEDTVGNVWSV
jgi:hypothetical protein